MSYRVLRDGPLGQTLCNTLGSAGPDCRHWLRGHARIIRDDDRSLAGLATIGGRECYIKLFARASRWPGLAWPGPAWPGLAWPGLAWPGLAWPGLSWPGLGWPTTQARALRSFDACQRLRRAHLAVPDALCCLGGPAGYLLVTEALPGLDLCTLWQGDPGHALDWLSIMQRSAQSVAALHRAQYAHGDCKWANLLLHGDCCALVDLETVRRAARASRRQASDLARFTLSAEELHLPLEYYHAFVEAYCSETSRDRAAVTAAVMPLLASMRRRRARSRQGYRGHQLLGEQ